MSKQWSLAIMSTALCAAAWLGFVSSPGRGQPARDDSVEREQLYLPGWDPDEPVPAYVYYQKGNQALPVVIFCHGLGGSKEHDVRRMQELAGDPNAADLRAILREVDGLHGRGLLDFAYLPGDLAEDGQAAQYSVLEAALAAHPNLPVRLIAVPEGALQGFNDEVLDLDHEGFARECAIDVPGPETDYLGGLARQWNAFVMAQAKARHPESV